MENILEKRRFSIEKLKMKVYNYLCKITKNCKFRPQKHQSFLIIKIQFLFWFIRYYQRYNKRERERKRERKREKESKIEERIWGYVKSFAVFEIQRFLGKNGGLYQTMSI